jgi:hypothetical protein
VSAGTAARVRTWLERAATEDVEATVVVDLLQQLGRSPTFGVAPHGTTIGYGPDPGGAVRRLVELDRAGNVVALLRWAHDGKLGRAWVRASDRTWVAIEPDVAYQEPWGRVDGLYRSERLVSDERPSGDPLTVLQSVDWQRIDGIPALAEPARVPPGAGTAVLNLIASLAVDQARRRIAYRGPYPTEQLFLALLESFRYDAGDEDPLAAFICGGLEWVPAPFERVFLPGELCLQLRSRIEKVTWRGRRYYRPDWQAVRRHAALRVEDAASGARCVLHALDTTLEPHLMIMREGDAVEVLAPPPSGTPTSMPAWVGPGVVALAAVASAQPLAPLIVAAGEDLSFEWGPIEAGLATIGEGTVRVSSGLRSALHEQLARARSSEARLGLAVLALEDVAQVIGDVLRAQAQARLLCLDAPAREAALETPPDDVLERRREGAWQAVRRAAEALLGEAASDLRTSGQ